MYHDKYVLIKSVDGDKYDGKVIHTADRYFVIQRTDGEQKLFPLSSIVWMEIKQEKQ